MKQTVLIEPPIATHRYTQPEKESSPTLVLFISFSSFHRQHPDLSHTSAAPPSSHGTRDTGDGAQARAAGDPPVEVARDPSRAPREAPRCAARGRGHGRRGREQVLGGWWRHGTDVSCRSEWNAGKWRTKWK